MSSPPPRVVLVTDGHASEIKAAAVQSVIEVTGVDPPDAVKLLSDNDWNASEAIAEFVNMVEFRNRLKEAQLRNGHRLCILSVHLVRLAHLKHTGMHSVRVELDGDVQQTGWISGDHAKMVGVSFEFRRFHSESRIKMEVWHRRTIRDNKMVGWCSWRITSLAEDPIMRFKGWIPLKYKQTTGGSLQVEIWLRFFDLPPSPPIPAPTGESSSSTSSKAARYIPIIAARNTRKIAQSETRDTREQSDAILQSKNLLDEFSQLDKAPISSPPSWDLGELDPKMFVQNDAGRELKDESRASSQERSSRGEPDESNYQTPNESEDMTVEKKRTEPYLMAIPLRPSYPSLERNVVAQHDEWNAWLETSPNDFYPEEQLPPDPWPKKMGPAKEFDRHADNFIRRSISPASRHEEREVSRVEGRGELKEEERGELKEKAPKFPTEHVEDSTDDKKDEFRCGNPWSVK